MKLLWYLNILCVCVSFLTPSHASAQNTPSKFDVAMGIAIVVNEDVITHYDIQQRLLFFLAASKTPNTPQNQQKILPELINSMVRETVQKQEINKNSIDVNENVIRTEMNNYAKQINFSDFDSMQKYFQQFSISTDTLKQQVFAQLGWLYFINKSFRNTVIVTDESISQRRQQILQQSKQKLVYQIYLSVDSANEKNTKQEQAESIRKLATTKQKFLSLASEFSQDKYASQKGLVGWLSPQSMPEYMRLAIEAMSVDSVSPVLHTDTGFFLIYFAETRSLDESQLDNLRIKQKLTEEQLQIFSETKLEEIIANSYIDIRL